MPGCTVVHVEHVPAEGRVVVTVRWGHAATHTYLDVLVLGVDGGVLQHCLQRFHKISCGKTVKEDNVVP